jgi:hypothetical protein
MANATVPYVANDGRLTIDVSANKTLSAAEFGWVQNLVADALVLTLPASATVLAGSSITIRNGGVPKTSGPAGSGDSGSIGFVVTPASGDGVTGNGFTAATDKGITYVKASGQVGDEITLQAGGANTAKAWNAHKVIGKLAAWTRTA